MSIFDGPIMKAGPATEFLKVVDGHPDRYYAQIGVLHVHATLLDEREHGEPDADGCVEWYVTGSEDRSEYHHALFEGYSDSLSEAEEAIRGNLCGLRDALASVLVDD